MTVYLLVRDPEPLAQLLARDFPTLYCIGWSERLETGLKAVDCLHPEVVLFDFATPGDADWSTVMPALRAAGAEVVVLSDLPTFAYEAFRLHASGFVLWPPDSAELQDALAWVAQLRSKLK